MKREIKTITACYPSSARERDKVSKRELVEFINDKFIEPINKVRKIEKNATGEYIINNQYHFTKKDLEFYLYEDYRQRMREEYQEDFYR